MLRVADKKSLVTLIRHSQQQLDAHGEDPNWSRSVSLHAAELTAGTFHKTERERERERERDYTAKNLATVQNHCLQRPRFLAGEPGD
jgi:hypothetical protein